MSSNYYGYPAPMQQIAFQDGAGTSRQSAYPGVGQQPYPGYGAYYLVGAGMSPQQQGYYAARPSQPFFNLGNDRFVKGLLIGAAAAYLLTNEDVQRTAIKGAVKLWSTVQGGVEEAKERFRDAEAELQASESGK